MIRFRCESCNQKMRVQPGWGGRSVRCPRCDEKCTVPTDPSVDTPPIADTAKSMPDMTDMISDNTEQSRGITSPDDMFSDNIWGDDIIPQEP